MAASPSRILELADIIQRQASAIQRYLAENNLPSPSFDARNASPVFPSQLDASRTTLIDATTELHDLMLEPADILHSRASNDLVSLHAVYRFKIAQAIPVGATATYTEISAATGLPASTLRRLLRHAMTMRVFCEPDKDSVAHTAASMLLAEDANMYAWLGANCEEIWPAATRTVDALQKWPDSVEIKHTGYALANGPGDSLFDVFAKDPSRGARFAGAMAAFAKEKSYHVDLLIRNYDWAALGSGLIVDVGGAHGHICKALAQNFVELRFVVEDLPEVIRIAEANRNDSLERVSFLAHDFFADQPVRGAKMFFFRKVLHDWPDKQVEQILRNLRPALTTGTRVLVQDFCAQSPGSGSLWQEKKLRTTDMTMLSVNKGQERDAEEWKAIFKDSDPRFHLIAIRTLAESSVALIEYEWRD